jgi:hypothetical protein
MTPKEKAKDLFEKMYNEIEPDELGKDYESAKQCALIAVDEIINADWYIPTFEDCKKWTSYWREVEQEINNFKQQEQ